RVDIPNADLITLLRKFLGQKRTDILLMEYRQQYNDQLDTNTIATTDFVQHCELLIGGVIGASSSRSVMQAVLSGKAIKFEDMLSFFGDTTDALSFNQNILYTSLESLDQGISVVNDELLLVAWNKRYLELFDYPSELIQVGTPVEDLIRYNAENGECGPGEIEQHVTKRMNYMRTGSQHRFLRERADGRVIEMVGNPLPKGGFVTSFTDITDYIETQQALSESNIDLEKRVEDRSKEVSEINAALKDEIDRRSHVEEALNVAKAEAEQANALKTRFLALASHDILQPLNAAKLYLASIEKSNLDSSNSQILDKVGISLSSTESLIQTLLEISRLDEGMIENDEKVFALNDVLAPLIQDFAIMAKHKGLKFHNHLTDVVVKTDPIHLRRIIQNLISNAIKYCNEGGVLIASRKRGNRISIEIYDTGPGISDYEQTQIYNEFYRIRGHNEPGVGLGLAVVSRLSELLDIDIVIKSNLGTGSRFSFYLDEANESISESTQTPVTIDKPAIALNVMCVDDAQENLDALAAVLNKWGCTNHLFSTPTDVIANLKAVAPDILLVDFQLNDEHYNGIELVAECRRLLGREIPAVLITAVRDKSLRVQAKEANISYLPKPVRPAALRALLSRHHK
ncbi:MAG: response regulator, partial [Enterobacterales bacterium]|nr:response regulator [Enterobacterales bacterium]